MKLFSTILILAVCLKASANDISKINELKKNAEIAFKHQQFDVAVSNYSYLIDTLQIYDEESIMNLGHAYYQLNQKNLAQSQYQKLVLSDNEQLKSVAYQQLGALSNDPKTLEKAMSYFKESIKSDPSNKDARYNYELVKKKLKDQQEQNQNQENQDQNNENQENQDEEKKDQDQKQNQEQQEGDQNQDQENQNPEDQQQQDQENQEQQNQEQEDQQSQDGKENEKEGDQQEQQQPQEGEDNENKDQKDQQQAPSPSDKMQEMNISEEKAKMILEALKNSEIQYIQQNRRKPTKRKESDKPDW
ncbi:tetratricopeptide repeat protein [Reichenbachiella sp.]|uniref:tetratricopeptide repeat protein n=1 Tax=Reichenbachiella sp. TaxID=2184521 RepID=UPI003BAE19BA